MTVNCNFTRSPAVVFQSVLAHNHPDTCDSPHVTKPCLRLLFSDMPLCGRLIVTYCMHINLMNCYGIMDNLYFTKMKIQ